jgi:hypothetical protein
MIDLATIINIIEQQRLRCHKPHFDDSQYDGRARINDWNNGVDSLARQITLALSNGPNEENFDHCTCTINQEDEE